MIQLVFFHGRRGWDGCTVIFGFGDETNSDFEAISKHVEGTVPFRGFWLGRWRVINSI